MKTKFTFNIRLLLLVLAFPVLASRCKKDPPSQSELVTVNDQSFGCRVDGVPFIADLWDYGNNIPPIRIRFRYSPVTGKTSLQVLAEKQNRYVEVWINSPVVSGLKELKFETRPYPIYNNPSDYGLYQIISPNKEHITNQTIGGSVNILSVDTVNQKIEASFEFTATDKITGEKISITNGYFKKS